MTLFLAFLTDLVLLADLAPGYHLPTIDKLPLERMRFALVIALSVLLSSAIGQRVPARCRGDIRPDDRAGCCTEFSVGCLRRSELCSTTPVLSFRPTPCATGLTCVITDFGFLPLDIPSRGQCRRLRGRIRRCSVPFCTRNGALGVCRIDGETTTCKAWATRRGVVGTPPDCNFACTLQFCPRFLGSDGGLYCTLCQLRGASCASNFMTSGPVAVNPCRRVGRNMRIRRRFRQVCCEQAGICGNTLQFSRVHL